MKEFKGTSGEWEVRNMKGIYPKVVCNGFNQGHLSISSTTSDKENEANAKLIAAAPELLKHAQWLMESMKAIQKHNPDCVINRDEIRMVNMEKAIEKAL